MYKYCGFIRINSTKLDIVCVQISKNPEKSCFLLNSVNYPIKNFVLCEGINGIKFTVRVKFSRNTEYELKF